MKRIAPLKNYTGETGYPLAGLLTRRGFLGSLAVGLAVGAAPAAGRGGPQPVVIHLRSRIRLDGCDYEVDRLMGSTPDARLAEFLRDGKEQAGTDAVLVKVLAAVTCALVADRRKLAALESRLAAAVQAHYRTRTRRAPGALSLTLVLRRRPVALPGEAPATSP